MQWTRRHRTLAWTVTALAAALIWIVARDTGMARSTPLTGGLPALLLVIAAVAITVGLLRRRGRRLVHLRRG